MPRTRRKVSRKQTRRGKQRGVMHVKSKSAVGAFERLLTKGPTIVFVYLKTCGPCHQFTNDVWNPLTKLKNKSMNLASVDSEVIGETSLGNVPRKFYPTIMLVGKDKKPAVFTDDNGEPTHSMPRNNSLSEDREVFTKLVQTPVKSLMTANSIRSNTSSPSQVSTSVSMSPVSMTVKDSKLKSPEISEESDAPESTEPTFMEMRKETNPRNTVSRSPFESKSPVPSILNQQINGMPTILPTRSMVPDVGADLVASQSKSRTGTAAVVAESMKGGMLESIRKKTASLKAILRLRKQHTRRLK